MTNNKAPLAAGQRWELPCPFYHDENDERWRPGTYETAYSNSASEGMGHEIREIIATFDLPKPYQPRVFFKRLWVAPDGYEFGKNQVRCIAVPSFKAWCNNGPSWNQQWAAGGASLATGDQQ